MKVRKVKSLRNYILYFGGIFMSKKSIISAILASLVVGTASTTFAASNPFSDVPSD